MSKVKKIDLAILRSMDAILSRSAGYEVSTSEEAEYFERESPAGWFVASDSHGNHWGFMRSFSQGDAWSLAEFYLERDTPDRKAIARDLLAHFLKGNIFATGHRLRFDLYASDTDLNSVIEEVPIRHNKQTFRFFETLLADISARLPAGELGDAKDAGEVADVLSHLHPVAEGEAARWLADGSIRLERSGGRVASAAHVRLSADAAEITRIATHRAFARQGFARVLVANLCAEVRARNIPRLFLRVDAARVPAMNFYRKLGLQEVVENKQIWHSLHF